MRVDSELIRSLRTARSWSQEELARAAGLNLRTIQRIEKEGVASLQSKKAVAAAFDIDATELDFQEKPLLMHYEYKILKFSVKGWMGGKLDGDDMEAQLNTHGAAGWELMGIVPVLKEMGQTTLLVATLKKPLEQSP